MKSPDHFIQLTSTFPIILQLISNFLQPRTYAEIEFTKLRGELSVRSPPTLSYQKVINELLKYGKSLRLIG